MNQLITNISSILQDAFEAAGYDRALGRVTVSNRPDLCEFQCNGAMSGAKQYQKAPIMIANDVASKLDGNDMFSKVEAVMPGFLNLDIAPAYLAKYVSDMSTDESLGCDTQPKADTIFLDYGGPNVAKPLHIGHLRSAIIGESLKRICKFKGYRTVGDAHLGDWGLQMGLIMMELKNRQPDLPYFDDSFSGEYPAEPPFTLAQLEEIYPCASAKSKEDDEFKKTAQLATADLQNGKEGYMALWRHIMNVSLPDLKANYDKLSVSFDLWKGESDAQPYIKDMVDDMIERGIAYESQGAIVVDIAREGDSKEFPPCIVRKSDGAANYESSDLATLIEREKLYSPIEYVYLADKRQDLHYTQFFRVAKIAGIVRPEAELKFIGFGTMNGADGKPFKTRQGGVMRLEYLINDVYEKMLTRILENGSMEKSEAEDTARTVALAAIKYGDLSNQAAKDYVFDIERFTSSEGNTGPYLLYTIVRAKSILRKYAENTGRAPIKELLAPVSESEKSLMLALSAFNGAIDGAFSDLAPHRICSYLYDLANAFNHFYHETKIMTEEDEQRQAGYVALVDLTRRVMEQGIDLLGFEAPERM